MLEPERGQRMDQGKIGAFIAQLRRERGWTQEELGERLGVTNKTVSRWENGNYMPGIELLALMGREFDVSLNELLEGRRLDDEAEFREAADKNLACAMESRLDRFWKWMERYGAYAALVLVLCCIIVMLSMGLRRYRRLHPGDTQTAGTYCTSQNPWELGEYIVLMKEWEGVRAYYCYRQFEALERGIYEINGDVVTVTAAGRSFDALLKGDCLYVADGPGKLTAFPKISDDAWFSNVDYKDFEK